LNNTVNALCCEDFVTILNRICQILDKLSKFIFGFASPVGVADCITDNDTKRTKQTSDQRTNVGFTMVRFLKKILTIIEAVDLLLEKNIIFSECILDCLIAALSDTLGFAQLSKVWSKVILLHEITSRTSESLTFSNEGDRLSGEIDASLAKAIPVALPSG
jgi:hypothetical protein